MSVQVDVESPEDIVRILRNAIASYPDAVEQAMWQEGEAIMNDSRRECPVDTGILRASSLQYPEVTVTPAAATLRLGYHTNYAVYVHERLDLYHAPPTKAKFLEDPVRAHAPKFIQNIVQRIEAIIGGTA